MTEDSQIVDMSEVALLVLVLFFVLLLLRILALGSGSLGGGRGPILRRCIVVRLLGLFGRRRRRAAS